MMDIEVESILLVEDHHQVTILHLGEVLHLHQDVVHHLVPGEDLLMKFLQKLNKKEGTGMSVHYLLL